MKKADKAVAISSSVKYVPDVYPAETEPREDDIVKLNTHIDDLLGDASGVQPGLPSTHQLLILDIKQITSFLG